MLDTLGQYIVTVADWVCGYPLFFLLIGGGLYLFISSGAVSLRRLPASLAELRRRPGNAERQAGDIAQSDCGGDNRQKCLYG